jgi:hypothetical protein
VIFGDAGFDWYASNCSLIIISVLHIIARREWFIGIMLPPVKNKRTDLPIIDH